MPRKIATSELPTLETYLEKTKQLQIKEWSLIYHDLTSLRA